LKRLEEPNDFRSDVLWVLYEAIESVPMIPVVGASNRLMTLGEKLIDQLTAIAVAAGRGPSWIARSLGLVRNTASRFKLWGAS
jgi:hypothetical protein